MCVLAQVRVCQVCLSEYMWGLLHVCVYWGLSVSLCVYMEAWVGPACGISVHMCLCTPRVTRLQNKKELHLLIHS